MDQENSPKNEESTGMVPTRLTDFNDGIFGFAMTLSVISINLPKVGEQLDINKYFTELVPNLINLFVSFIILAFFWILINQYFHHIAKTNRFLILVNILMLFSVILVPFSTSLFNDYPHDKLAALFFNLNILVLSIFVVANWLVAAKGNLIKSTTNQEHITKVNQSVYFLPMIPLLGLIIAIFSPAWSIAVYVLFIIALFYPMSGKN